VAGALRRDPAITPSRSLVLFTAIGGDHLCRDQQRGSCCWAVVPSTWTFAASTSQRCALGRDTLVVAVGGRNPGHVESVVDPDVGADASTTVRGQAHDGRGAEIVARGCLVS